MALSRQERGVFAPCLGGLCPTVKGGRVTCQGPGGYSLVTAQTYGCFERSAEECSAAIHPGNPGPHLNYHNDDLHPLGCRSSSQVGPDN